jgi:hypothetical protein
MDTNNDINPSKPVEPSTPASPTPPINPLATSPDLKMDKPVPQQPVVAAAPVNVAKGKSMLWVIILLIILFLCGLLLAAWYFQTQFQKIVPG